MKDAPEREKVVKGDGIIRVPMGSERRDGDLIWHIAMGSSLAIGH